MSQAYDTSRKNRRKPSVRQAHIPKLDYEDMSELGRDLFDLSRDYEASGEQLLTEDEIEDQITLRRGGFTQDNAT
jgi:hypothetical protein